MKKYMLAVSAVLLLAGCQTQKETSQTETTTQSSTQTEQTSASSATTSEASSEKKSEVTYNGSYYSVQGKYGEVIIVNKKHPLSPDYNPGENPEAKAAFDQLLAAMKAQGFALSDEYSGFRSYELQSSYYDSYVAAVGKEAAERDFARPGYSEHQTGLAFDFKDAAGNLLEEPEASAWLAQHAHEYGFIVRYVAGKEDVTGYVAESWHIRYIGQEATDIYNSGLTLEEYFGVEGGQYAE